VKPATLTQHSLFHLIACDETEIIKVSAGCFTGQAGGSAAHGWRVVLVLKAFFACQGAWVLYALKPCVRSTCLPGIIPKDSESVLYPGVKLKASCAREDLFGTGGLGTSHGRLCRARLGVLWLGLVSSTSHLALAAGEWPGSENAKPH